MPCRERRPAPRLRAFGRAGRARLTEKLSARGRAASDTAVRRGTRLAPFGSLISSRAATKFDACAPRPFTAHKSRQTRRRRQSGQAAAPRLRSPAGALLHSAAASAARPRRGLAPGSSINLTAPVNLPCRAGGVATTGWPENAASLPQRLHTPSKKKIVLALYSRLDSSLFSLIRVYFSSSQVYFP